MTNGANNGTEFRETPMYDDLRDQFIFDSGFEDSIEDIMNRPKWDIETANLRVQSRVEAALDKRHGPLRRDEKGRFVKMDG